MSGSLSEPPRFLPDFLYLCLLSFPCYMPLGLLSDSSHGHPRDGGTAACILQADTADPYPTHHLVDSLYSLLPWNFYPSKWDPVLQMPLHSHLFVPAGGQQSCVGPVLNPHTWSCFAVKYRLFCTWFWSCGCHWATSWTSGTLARRPQRYFSLYSPVLLGVWKTAL